METMKILLTVSVAIFGFFQCISAREDCIVEMRVEGIDNRMCRIASILELDRESNSKDTTSFDNYILLQCLLHIEKQKECDSKSNIVPQFLE